MSDPWPKVPLGKVLMPVSRPEKVQTGKTYNLLGTRWYAGGLFIKNTCDGSELRADKVYRVERGDFVYNRLFAWKGSFALTDDAAHGCYVSNEFPCFQPNSERIDPRYLQRYMSRESAWNEALGLSSGGTPTSRNRLKEEKLLGMAIPLPTLAEQQRVVVRIERLAAKIAESRSLRHQATEEVAALAHSARRNSLGASVQPDWIPLSHYVAEIENGKSPATEGRPAASDEWGVLKVGAVSYGIFDERENKALPVSFNPIARFEVKSGDFIVSRANTAELVGACAVVHKTRAKLMLSDKTFRFIFRNPQQIDTSYLDHMLKSSALREQIIAGASGTSPTMKNISKKKVLNLRLPPHSLTEQCRIVAYLDGLQAKVDALKRLQAETAAELDALLPSILDRAFKGEL